MSNISFDEIGQRIKHKRKEKGYTQAQLAAFLGLNVKTIITWEKGKLSGLTFPDLLTLCAALDIDITYLLGGAYSTNEIKNICEYTGLTEKTVKILHHTKNNVNAQNIPAFLSHLMDHYFCFMQFIEELEEFMKYSYLEKHFTNKRAGAANPILYQKYRDKSALSLLQCQRLIDNLKTTIEKDEYIKNKVSADSPIIKTMLKSDE